MYVLQNCVISIDIYSPVNKFYVIISKHYLDLCIIDTAVKLSHCLYSFNTSISHCVENYFPWMWGVGISDVLFIYL